MADPSPDFAAFLKNYPSYRDTQLIDDLRRSQYGRLDAGEHVYLDYTGGGLYAESQLQQHQELLRQNVSLLQSHFAGRHTIRGQRSRIGAQVFQGRPARV